MAHPEQYSFVKYCMEQLVEDINYDRALEIGSYIVNEGGTIRTLIPAEHYIGVDLTEGPGVDLVEFGHKVDFEEKSFDLCVSCECFEHDQNWNLTFANMYKLLKEDRPLVFTCGGKGRIEHGTSRSAPDHSPPSQEIGWDYYRNLAEKDFTKHFKIEEMFSTYLFFYNRHHKDLYFIGIKRSANPQVKFDVKRAESEINDLMMGFANVYNNEGVLKIFRKQLERRLILDPLLWLSPNKLYQDYQYLRRKFVQSVRLFGLR